MPADTTPDPNEVADPTALDLDDIAEHIEEERRQISILGEVREAVFGAQDGLVSTLAVVATVTGATNDNLAILVAGIASAMAGIFSMGIGEYMSSKSQAEIFQWHVADEREEVEERPEEAQAEVAYMFMEEGMDEQDAWSAARIIGRHPTSLLSTMVAKELGIAYDEAEETSGTPLRGALVMAGAFALGALPPLVPFLFLTGFGALMLGTVLSGLALFGIGAAKSRWTHRSWVWSGLEIVALAAVAGVAGYFFGGLLPDLLGFAVPTA